MNGSSYKLTIPKGAQIHEETISVDSHTACDIILATEKQFKYTCFEMCQKEDIFKFTRHFVVCNNCGQHTPAYHHSIEGTKVSKRFSRESTHLWFDEALSFFETQKKRIVLYKPITEKDHFKCMYCGSEPRFTEQKVFITFKMYRNKLTVTYPLTDIGDVIAVNWPKQVLTINSFPLSESVTFNFKRGTTYIALKSTSGKPLAIMDITNGITDLTNFTSPLINMISDNVTVKRALYKHFAKIWGKRIPFKEWELDIHKLARINAFVGYDDKIFYSYIPYDYNTTLFDKSYKSICKKMHYANKLVDVYKKSSLPDMKQIRKSMFENPKLFFYIKELEKLWVFSQKEHNFFSAFLNNQRTCSILAFLHDHPLAFELYKDVFKEKLHVSFREVLFRFPKNVNEYAIAYSTFSDNKKAEAIKEIKKTSCRCLRYKNNTTPYFYSIPDYETINSIETQNINGYIFTTLKTVNDYIIAGEQLDNCLGKEEFDTPVVGIMRGSKYVAAFQVDTDQKYIYQAYSEHNQSIELTPPVFAAFQKWCKNNNYEYDESNTYGL